MANCNTCGAGTSPGKVICEFCGAPTQDIETLSDELKAVHQLGEVAKKMLQKKDRFGVAKSAMGGKSQKEKMLTFFRSAYMPRHLEAQDQLLNQVLALMNMKFESGVGFLNYNPYLAGVKAQVQKEINDGMQDFAKRITDNMDMLHGDGVDKDQRRVKLATTRVEVMSRKAASSGKKTMMLSMLMFLLIMGGNFAIFGFGLSKAGEVFDTASDQPDEYDTPENRMAECRGVESSVLGSNAGDPEVCDDACRVMACAQVCDPEKAPWACDGQSLFGVAPSKGE
jgi:hypothetical protein